MTTIEEKDGVYTAVARVIYLLTQGTALTTQEIADLTGRTRQTAYRLMSTIESSHHVPVYFDPQIGAWRIVRRDGHE